MVFFKTTLFLYFFLCMTGPLSAQENSVPVKIESPTSSFVSRSFTISGSAQAGAKLHLSINGKTFGRYRADIGGRFTIGVSIPEDKLFIKIDHLVDGEIQSSDSITLKVGAEKILKKIEEPKKDGAVNDPLYKSQWNLKQSTEPETKKTLPTAGKIPAKPGDLKSAKPGLEETNKLGAPKTETGEPDAFANEAWEKDPVVLDKNPNPYSTQGSLKNGPTDDMGGRIGYETLGIILVTGAIVLVAFSLAGNGSIPDDELFIGLFLAEIVLAPVGVYIGGNFGGGKADLWMVYLGELAGLAGSVAFAAAGSAIESNDVQFVFGLLALISPFVGMVVGYEISHARNAKISRTFSMQPTIQINQDVKSLGLRFRF